jgi:hypothetical protein
MQELVHISETQNRTLIEGAKANGWTMKRTGRGKSPFGLYDPWGRLTWATSAGKGMTSEEAWDIWELCHPIEAAFAEVYTADTLEKVLGRVNELAWYAKAGDEATIEFGTYKFALTWERS